MQMLRSRYAILAAAITGTIGFAAQSSRAGEQFLTPTDPIIAIDAVGRSLSSSPAGEESKWCIDGDTGTTKYLNFGERGSGFIVVPTAASVMQSFVLTTGNDAAERDPTAY